MIVSSRHTGSSPFIKETGESDKRVSNKFLDTDITNMFLKKMPTFFEKKEYGKGIKEIMYNEICLSEEFKIFGPKKDDYYWYGKRKKTAVIVVDLAYDLILEMIDILELKKYLRKSYIEATDNLLGLNIPDFDFTSYAEDISLFFKDWEN